MSDYNLLDHVLQLGGVITSTVDTQTGELLFDKYRQEGPRGEGVADRATPLVLNGGIASRKKEGGENGHFERLNRRFKLQDQAGKLLPKEAVSTCLKWRFNNSLGVGIHYAEKFKKAHFSNLQTCGLPWVCPVCAAKISERRRVELAEAVNTWQSWGGSVFLGTFTLKHNSDDNLDSLLDDLNSAFRGLKSGRFWQDFKSEWGIVGSVSSLEITYGQVSGFHPHKHVLFFCDKLTALQAGEIEHLLSGRWQKVLSRFERYASWEHGVKVDLGDSSVGDYVSKDWNVVSEVTKTSSKVGRDTEHYSPFQLLDLFASGSSWAGAVFLEYAKATKGRNLLTWSPGLRDLLVLGQELTDLEIVEKQEEKAIMLLTLLLPEWKIVLKNRARAMLLEVAATGRLELVYAYLRGIGVYLEGET